MQRINEFDKLNDSLIGKFIVYINLRLPADHSGNQIGGELKGFTIERFTDEYGIREKMIQSKTIHIEGERVKITKRTEFVIYLLNEIEIVSFKLTGHIWDLTREE